MKRDEIESAKSAKGGWTREQLAAWGISWATAERLAQKAGISAKRDILRGTETAFQANPIKAFPAKVVSY